MTIDKLITGSEWIPDKIRSSCLGGIMDIKSQGFPIELLWLIIILGIILILLLLDWLWVHLNIRLFRSVTGWMSIMCLLSMVELVDTLEMILINFYGWLGSAEVYTPILNKKTMLVNTDTELITKSSPQWKIASCTDYATTAPGKFKQLMVNLKASIT